MPWKATCYGGEYYYYYYFLSVPASLNVSRADDLWNHSHKVKHPGGLAGVTDYVNGSNLWRSYVSSEEPYIDLEDDSSL